MIEPRAGVRLGTHLRLLRPLALGGMGQLWVARQEILGADVVVKLLRYPTSYEAREAQRLLREGMAAVRVRSPHAVRVIDAGVDQGLGVFVVMELLEGESLADALARDRVLPPRSVGCLVAHVAHALGRAHEAGIVHRDIKPSNVFLARSSYPFFAKVLDFGIAELGLEPLTETGTVVGTLAYMSPEQLCGAPLDGRSDLYALGLLAFYALTGRQALEPDAVKALGMAAYKLPLPRASEIVPGLPPALDAWFLRACAFAPGERFESADAMAAAFAEALASEVPKWPPSRRGRRLILGATALVTVVLLALAVLWGLGRLTTTS